MKSEDLDKHLRKKVQIYFKVNNDRERNGPFSGILEKNDDKWFRYKIGNILFSEEIADIYSV